MKRKIKLTESDLIRVIKKVINEQEEMIQGISISDLHPYVYESLKNKKKLTAAQMLKMMAGCYEDDEDGMMTLDGGASNYTSTASGGQKINQGSNRKKGRLYKSYSNASNGQTWENLCDFPDQIYGEWLNLPGFDWDQELLKSINDYWKAVDGLKNMDYEDTAYESDPDTGDVENLGLSMDEQEKRYEAGKKLMWKFDDQRSWYLVVR